MSNNVTDLGKVGITLKNEWSNDTSYERLDVVTYEGSSYVSKIDNNSNSNPSTSPTKWQLIAKHGEFTEQQLEDFKAEVVADSKEEIDDYTDDKKGELDTYTGTKKSELDTYEGTKESELNTYAGGLKDTFDSNASNKTSAFNSNASDKTTAFNSNASDKTTAFDNNASSKTGDFNTNASSKTTAFNDNASSKTTDFNTNATNKTTAFDSNATSKTTAFNQNATEKTAEFDANAQEIQNEIDDINELIETELNNVDTEESTRVDINDSAKWYGGLKIIGNTEQAQYTGKNLFNINDVVAQGGISIDTSDNILTLTATGTNGAQYGRIEIGGFDGSKTYSFFCNAKKTVSGTDGNPLLRVYIYGSNDGSTYTLIKSAEEVSPTQGNEYSFAKTLTGYTYYRFFLYNNGSTPVTLGEQSQYYNIQLEEGSTATDYEQYVGGIPSPNPDYPQEIKRVVGRTCRNLFDKDHANILNAFFGSSRIIESGAATRTLYIPIEPSKTYTVSKIKSTKFRVMTTTSIPENNLTGEDTYIANDTGNSITITTTANSQYLCVYYYNSNNDTLTEQEILDTIQIEEGNSATAHDAFFEGKKIDITICNKNLFDENEVVFNSGMLDGDGNPYTGGSHYTANFYPVKPETLYSFTGTIVLDTYNYRIYYYDKNKEWISRSGPLAINNTTFTTPANCYYIRIQVTTSITLKTGDIMLCEGTDTTYVKNEHQTFSLNIGDMELCKIRNAEDFFFKNTTDNPYYNSELVENGWYKYEAIGKVIGSSDFTSNGIDDNRVGLVTPILNIEANLGDLSQMAYCNLLTTTQKNYSGLNGTTTGNKIRVYVSKTYASTFTEAKQVLADIIIYFVQLTPTYTQITDQTLISQLEEISKFKCYYGVNHIWSETGEIDANLILNYYKSNKLRLDNIEARLELLED